MPDGLDPQYCQCLRLCCARERCRQRATPPSLRFLGRKVYLGALVLLISAMRWGPTPTWIAQLQTLVGVSHRTVLRWRQWWHEVFTQSAFWRAAAADFMPPVEHAALTASLLARFGGNAQAQLIALLRFLSPINTGIPVVRLVTNITDPQKKHLAGRRGVL